ncbi:pilin [Streptomyces sp. NPDC059009]|uniref:pilin n=1 Tax=Streptomyces sp. NPDC059009 TaxID=3346694 RepID=UPI0036CDE1E4
MEVLVVHPGSAARPAIRRAAAAHRATSSVILLAAAVAVLVAFGPATPVVAEPKEILALAGSINEVLNNIRNWLMGVLAALATVFLTLGGLRYLMAGGDPGEISKAKDAFKNAGYGYGLAALAPLVVEILKGIVGA